MVRRENGEGPSAGACAGYEDAAGLRHEGVTFGNSCVAAFQRVHVVWLVGAAHRKPERFTCKIDELSLMRPDAFPAFVSGDLAELDKELRLAAEQIKIRAQFDRILLKKGDAFVKALANGWQ